MQPVRLVAAILVSAATLQGQGPPPSQPPPPAPGLTGEAAVAAALSNLDKTQMSVQGLSQALRILQANLKVAEGVKAQVDRLSTEAASAQTAGNLGAARRHLLQAIALQRGQAWDDTAAFAGSLRLRTSARSIPNAGRPSPLARRPPWARGFPSSA